MCIVLVDAGRRVLTAYQSPLSPNCCDEHRVISDPISEDGASQQESFGYRIAAQEKVFGMGEK